MKPLSYFLLVFLLAAVCLAEAPAQAKVLIYPVDTFGVPLTCDLVQVINRRSDNDKIAVHVLDSGVCLIDNVPEGEIAFQVRALGFPPVQKTLRIADEKNVSIQAVFPFPFEGPPLAGEIRGTLNPENSQDVWINLVGVFVLDHYATKVDTSGHYELKHVEPGAYFLIVSSKGKILASRYLAVAVKNDPVNIHLSQP